MCAKFAEMRILTFIQVSNARAFEATLNEL